jgi:hypothetical protein
MKGGGLAVGFGVRGSGFGITYVLDDGFRSGRVAFWVVVS